MKKILPACCILAFGVPAMGQQAKLLRQVVASSGGSALIDKTIVQYTIGEPAVLTLDAPKLILTQGFQQPEVTGNAPVTEPAYVTGFIVFPNPANKQTKLEFDLLVDTRVTIQLVNNGGQTLRTVSINMLAGKVSYPMQLNGFAAGLYYVVVRAGSRNYTEKLVIQ